MIKYILAGTAATAVAVTVGVIVLKKDLACEYSPNFMSNAIGCNAVQTQAVANTEAATQNDDVSPTAGSQEVEQKAADEPAEAEVAEVEAPAPVAEEVAEQIVPTFDIVRVEPDGSTLVAGRSAADAKIILRDGDKNIGETTANDTGEWVIVVDEPIQAATATLSLLAMLPDGTSIESTATVEIAMYKEAPADQAADATTEQKPVIKLADAAGEKADGIIAETEDAVKQAVTEVTDETSEAVEKTVEQAEILAQEAAALLKKAADKAAEAAEAEADAIVEEAAPIIEEVETLPLLVNEVAEEAVEETTEMAETVEETIETTVAETIEPVEETVAKVMDEMSSDATSEPVAEVTAETVAEPVADESTTVEAEANVAEVNAPATNEPIAETAAEETPQIATETEEFLAPEPEVAQTDEVEAVEAEAQEIAANTTTEAVPTETEAEPAEQDKTPLVVISEEGKASKILQGAGTGSQSNEMTFNSMDYNEKGEIIFSGDAKPSEMVRVYINNEFIGEAMADADGRWSLDQGYVMQAGANSLRFDQVDAAGKVMSRRETNITMPKLAQVAKTEEIKEETPKAADPVEQAAATVTAAEPKVEPIAKTQISETAQASEETSADVEIIEVKGGRAIIIWGDNLWNISRKIYGKGELYTTIFKANKDQIRNPDLIYPGQVFLLPENVDIQ